MSKCRLCNGNNADAPCAVPEAMSCLKVKAELSRLRKERDELEHSLDVANERRRLQEGIARSLERLNNELNTTLKERDTQLAELMAMVNELREEFIPFISKPQIGCDGAVLVPTDAYNAWVRALNKTPAQSLHDRDMEVAERVRESCAVTAWGSGMDAFNNGNKYRETREQGSFCADAIRNLDLTEALKQ